MIRDPAGLPATGVPLSEVKRQLELARQKSATVLKRGDIVYPPGDEVLEAALAGATAFFQSNALYRNLFAEVIEYESDLVQMAIDLFHGGGDARGTLTSGGTESILLAVKSARDRAAANSRATATPTILAAASAHPAFARAADYFGMQLSTVPLRDDFTVDLDAYLAAIDADTVLMVGSAPSYPTGLVDPIEEMAGAAAERGIAFHVDGCLGGFFLPFAERAREASSVPRLAGARRDNDLC